MEREKENLYICENDNLNENLQKLIDNGYKYIIKACDKFLSGWGGARGKKHIELIACKTAEEREIIIKDLKQDKSFNYIDFQYIDNKKAIYQYVYHKSYTIRNDWTRCF